MIDFDFEQEFTMLEHKDNEFMETNSYKVVSKASGVKEKDLLDVIQIVDESGSEVTCTYDKFIEIFDEQGLSGFIL